MFIQLYPDVMGNYVLRLYGVFDLPMFWLMEYPLFYYILFHIILFIQLYPDVIGNCVLRLYGGFNLLCFGRWNSQNLFLLC